MQIRSCWSPVSTQNLPVASHCKERKIQTSRYDLAPAYLSDFIFFYSLPWPLGSTYGSHLFSSQPGIFFFQKCKSVQVPSQHPGLSSKVTSSGRPSLTTSARIQSLPILLLLFFFIVFITLGNCSLSLFIMFIDSLCQNASFLSSEIVLCYSFLQLWCQKQVLVHSR